MRLWTVHPKYLDARGLVATWREALLAQKVLAGQTRGYRNHPQLQRFRAHADPQAMIAAFLGGIADEAGERGYRFDTTKIGSSRPCAAVEETRGQLEFEWRHLLAKLADRAPSVHARWASVEFPDPHPLFVLVDGPIQPWEKT